MTPSTNQAPSRSATKAASTSSRSDDAKSTKALILIHDRDAIATTPTGYRTKRVYRILI